MKQRFYFSKRISFFVCLLAFCLLMSACMPAADPEGKFYPPDSGTVREGSWDYDLAEVPYHYGNALTTFDFCEYGPKVLLVVFLNESDCTLCEYDKRTGRVDPLCKDPSCRHTTSACPVYNVDKLELYRGKVYGLRSDIEKGLFTSTMVELKNGRLEPQISSINGFKHFGDDIFTVSDSYSLLRSSAGSKTSEVLLEEGKGLNRSVALNGFLYYPEIGEKVSLYRIPLDRPEEKECVIKEIGYHYDYGYITDGEFFYYIDSTYHLFRCDLDGKNAVQIGNMMVSDTCLNYDEQYLYFGGNDPTDSAAEINFEIYRVPKDLSSEPELLANVGFEPISIFVPHQFDALFLTEGLYDYYTIEKDGTGLKLLEFPV